MKFWHDALDKIYDKKREKVLPEHPVIQELNYVSSSLIWILKILKLRYLKYLKYLTYFKYPNSRPPFRPSPNTIYQNNTFKDW